MAIRSPASPVLYQKLISDALRARRVESIAELVEDVKRACTRLRIPYGHGEIDDAIAAMGERINREIAPPVSRHVERAPEPHDRPLSHGEAAAAYRRVGGAVRTMPTPERAIPRDVLQRVALMRDAIDQSIARCAALEANPPKGDDE